MEYGYTNEDINKWIPLCLNGSTCAETDTEPYFQCTCKPGFEGVRCNGDINECAPKPCKNGARCIDQVANYSCECKPGFQGRNCEENIDE